MTIRQLEGPDAAFLYGERPEWHFHVSALLILDPSTSERFSVEEVVAQLGRRIHLVPQFRWKLVEGPLRMRLERPIWVDDADFAIEQHVSRVALPDPGDDRALGELVGRLVSIKLDRSRPLWEMWIIEGLAEDQVALLLKVHHSLIDGQSGSEMATLLFDVEPDPEPDPDPPPFEPEPPPPLVARLTRASLNAAGWPLKASRFSLQLIRQGVATGRHLLQPDAPVQPFQAPRTPLNGRLTSERAFTTAHVSLADAKRVRRAFGVKLNDVVLAVCATALRDYLLDHGGLPDAPLVAQVPVSIRDAEAAGGQTPVGTRVAAMFCSLATDVEDPVHRLRAIHRSSTSGKALRQELTDAHEVNLTDTTPPAAIAIAARTWSLAGLDARTPPIFNLIISNVAGPPFELYVAGARIDAMYPMGPLLYGSGVNFTVVSNADRLDFGLMSCPALVPDAQAIADRIPGALATLVDAIDDGRAE